MVVDASPFILFQIHLSQILSSHFSWQWLVGFGIGCDSLLSSEIWGKECYSPPEEKLFLLIKGIAHLLLGVAISGYIAWNYDHHLVSNMRMKPIQRTIEHTVEEPGSLLAFIHSYSNQPWSKPYLWFSTYVLLGLLFKLNLSLGTSITWTQWLVTVITTKWSMIFVQKYYNLFIHPTVHEYSGRFQFLAFRNHAVMNILAHVLYWICPHFFCVYA